MRNPMKNSSFCKHFAHMQAVSAPDLLTIRLKNLQYYFGVFQQETPKMRHGGRIPYLYHFSKGRTHGTAVQRSYGRKEYEKGHHTGRGKGCRGFAVHGVPCAQQQWLRGRRRPPPRGRSHGSAALFAQRYCSVSFQKPFAHDRRDRAADLCTVFQPDVLHCRPHYGAVRLPSSAM